MFPHRLPAHRGDEATDGVLDGFPEPDLAPGPQPDALGLGNCPLLWLAELSTDQDPERGGTS